MDSRSFINIRLKISLIICCLLSLLTACHNDTGEKEISSGTNHSNTYNNSSNNYNGNKAIVHGLEVNEKGYYYLVNNILHFYDMSSDLSMPMCSRTECSHTNESCDAYARDTYTVDDSTWHCDGKELMLYNDNLYMIEHSKENDYYIVQYDTSFNNKNVIVQLSDFQNKSQILSADGSYAIYNDYLYYCVYDYSEEAVKGDYMFKFHCMRVKLEKDAVPEKLGEFDYPGDYAVVAGSSEGISVMCRDDNIYYFASDYSRAWVHENVEQCAIMKYNTKTSEFKNMYSSTIGWDSEIGKIEGSDANTCIDKNGIIYAISDDVNIVSIDVESGEKKIIYSYEYNRLGDSLSSLVCDGQYIYFITMHNSPLPMSTCIKVIDTTGKEINSYEFEVNDEYRDKDGNVATCGNVQILGLDNRNIVILSRSSAYKGLSTDRKLSAYEPRRDIGVGLIPLSDFLEGKDITIKQIYKY